MKNLLFLFTLSLFGSHAFAADANPTPAKPDAIPAPPHPGASQVQIQIQPVPAAKPGAAATPAVSGKAVIMIEVNGQKQTREIDLGNSVYTGTTTINGADQGIQAHPNATLSVTGGTLKTGTGTLTFSPDGDKGQSPTVRRTWLGVSTDQLSGELHAQLPLAEGTGLIVRSVMAESPAAQAGLRANDVLVKLDDQILINEEQLRALIRTKKEGDVVHLTYLRVGHEATVDAKLGVREESEGFGVLNISGIEPLILQGTSQAQSLVGELQNLIHPLLNPGAVVTDKNGNVIAHEGKGDVSEAVKQLEKALREAGVNENVITQMNKALTQSATAMQKAAGDIATAKENVAREVQRAAEEARKAAEQAARQAAEAARQANPSK